MSRPPRKSGCPSALLNEIAGTSPAMTNAPPRLSPFLIEHQRNASKSLEKKQPRGRPLLHPRGPPDARRLRRHQEPPHPATFRTVMILSSERHADPPNSRHKFNPGLTMTDVTMTGTLGSAASSKPKLDQPVNPLTLILFFGVLAAGFLFVAYSLYIDVDATGAKVTTFLPFLLLF